MAEIISSFKELRAYQEAVRLQDLVFEETKLWPKEELYALTSQIRRSSRAIGAAMAEAWAKRRYPAHFLSKLTDAENNETETWLCFAKDCGQLSPEKHFELLDRSRLVGRMLGGMLRHPKIFCPPETDPRSPASDS